MDRSRGAVTTLLRSTSIQGAVALKRGYLRPLAVVGPFLALWPYHGAVTSSSGVVVPHAGGARTQVVC